MSRAARISLSNIDNFVWTAIFKYMRSRRGRPDQIALPFRRHGGARKGAGRKPSSPRPPVQHVRRPRVPGYCPSLVTVRVRPNVPSLRSRAFIAVFGESLRRGCERGEFRVCQFSIQRDHVHLLVEATGKDALARGMKSVTMRLVWAASRAFGRRGPVLYGRYHLKVLRTPREVRNALAYLLMNVRKHWQRARGAPPPVRLDAASSGGSFDGWRRPGWIAEPRAPASVAPARTWLLTIGWRRHGLLDPAEVPGGRRLRTLGPGRRRASA